MPEIVKSNVENYAIIVAGGSGTRMQNAVPKQFLLLNEKPVVMHTIEAFHQSEFKPSIILVLPFDYHNHWKTLCSEYNFQIPHVLVSGGKTRFHSVQNALAFIPDDIDFLIAIHDAVRPLTSKQIIDSSYQLAALHGNAVTAVKSRDSVILRNNGTSKSVLRDSVFLVQTPQTFQSSQIKKAYKEEFNLVFTDDASVVESVGFNINILEGQHTEHQNNLPGRLENS